MADPQTLAQARRLVSVYEEAERIMLAKIARRVARGASQPGWTEAKLAQVTAMEGELRQATRDLSRRAGATLDQVLLAAQASGARGVVDLASLGPVRARLVSTHLPAVRGLYLQTVGSFDRAHVVILRRALDAYRAVVAESSMFAVAGVLTRQQATQRALDRLAMAGIRSFTDRRGRPWDMASYAEMGTRTAIGHAHLEGRLEAFKARGYELFVIAGGETTCPLCGPWAGVVLSEQPHPEAQATLSQARSSGLFHPNCGHSIVLYSRGFTQPQQPSKDPRAYELTQRQRAMERSVRAWKRRQAVATTPEARRLASSKVREHQAALRRFTREHRVRRLYHREAVRTGS